MSPVQYNLIPIFDDNYVFVLSNKQCESKIAEFIIIDPGEAKSISKYLSDLKLNKEIKLNIFLTHHHPDHIGGVSELTKLYDCKIWGPKLSLNRIPEIQYPLIGGEKIVISNFEFEVIALPGHTLDHISYFEKNQQWLFLGDVLFKYGCGRLFEGDYPTAFHSLEIVKNMPVSTLIFCTHEYTQKNILFALHQAQIENDQIWLTRLQSDFERIQELRAKNSPTVPFLLKDQISDNPFLCAQNVEEFKKKRIDRNTF